MKSVLFAALAITLGVMFFFYRRRLKLALIVAGSLYACLTLIRLFVMREEVDRFTSLALVLVMLLGIWLTINLLTALMERRRKGRVRR